MKDYTNFGRSALLSAMAIIVLSSTIIPVGENRKAFADDPACAKSKIAKIFAGSHDGVNLPSHTLDSDITTQWSSYGEGSWVRLDLGEKRIVCSVNIAWDEGQARKYDFAIEASADGSTFTKVYQGQSSGETKYAERNDFSDTTARYLRITVDGNQWNNWASVSEIVIYSYDSSGDVGETPDWDNDTDSKLLIRIMSINNDGDTERVVERHLGAGDFVNNFRVKVLEDYPTQKQALNEASLADIRYAIGTEIPRSRVDVDYIEYDNEGWDLTPEWEQADHAGSTNKATKLIHDAGYKSGVAPTRRILMEELNGVQWSNVDYVVMQLQKVVGEHEFKEISDKVTDTVRRQNPDIIIFAQVNPRLNSISEIVNSINSIRGDIDGVGIVWDMEDSSKLDKLLVALGR